MSSDDAINIMKISDLKKSGLISTFLLYIKNQWNSVLSKKERDNIK